MKTNQDNATAESVRHPIQPLYKDEYGVLRFKSNSIVRFLLDCGPHDLNYIAKVPFSQEDREQFAQLIGYSLCGFMDLSYASKTTCDAAKAMAKGNGDRRNRGPRRPD